MKGIEKLFLCHYAVIMHSGNVVRIRERRVKHTPTPRLYTVLSYSPNIALVHYRSTMARDSFSIC